MGRGHTVTSKAAPVRDSALCGRRGRSQTCSITCAGNRGGCAPAMACLGSRIHADEWAVDSRRIQRIRWMAVRQAERAARSRLKTIGLCLTAPRIGLVMSDVGLGKRRRG
jgi:hypothetical protein